MIQKIRFLGLLFSFVTVTATAQVSAYLNFWYDDNGNVSVSQDSVSKCDEPSGCLSRELGSLSETAANLKDLLNSGLYWKDVAGGSFSLKSDLDLGQLDASGNCIVNHTPLSFVVTANGKLQGNGHTVKNMCYSHVVDYSDVTNTRMNDPVGFFSKLKDVQVSDIHFENVKLSIADSNGTTKNSRYYAPMGALAGSVMGSTISKVSLGSVSVAGPASGGVVGASESSSFDNVTSSDKIALEPGVYFDSSTVGKTFGLNNDMDLFHTFLGGIAGYSVNTNISNVNLSVNIQNATEDRHLAMGGLVGLFTVSDEKNDSMAVATNTAKQDSLMIKDAFVGSSTNSAFMNGGLAMGGLVGQIASFGNGNSASLNVSISNSSFDGTLENTKLDTLYMGGLVGRIPRDYTNMTYSIVFDGCQSNAILKGTAPESAGAVFAGGVMGYAGCNLNNAVDVGPVVRHTNVSGSIELTDGEASGERKVKVMAGGIVGYGCFAASDETTQVIAMENDIVQMNVNVDIRTSDTVAVGGFVGEAGIPEQSSMLKVFNSAFAGNLNVHGASGNLYVAGALGRDFRAYDNLSVRFQNISVAGNPLITIKGDGSAMSGAKTFVGGLSGESGSLFYVDQVGVSGNIEIDSTYGDSLYAGGLLGKSVCTGLTVNLQNTYYIGTLGVETQNYKSANVGYLAGYISVNQSMGSYSLMSNYHYGLDDWQIVGSIKSGLVYTDLLNDLPRSGSSFYWNVNSNIRNGSAESLDSDDNGTKLVDSMKTATMKDLLLKPVSADTPAWAYDAEINDGFPYLANVSGAQIPEINSSSSSAPAVVYKAKSWNMVSLKGLEEIGVRPAKEDLAYWWDESTQMGEYWQYQAYDSRNVDSGDQGYWLWSVQGVDVELPDDIDTVDKVIQWEIDSINSGWNLVANPYGFSVALDSESLQGVNVWCWSESGYVYKPDSLKPYEGAWVFANSSAPSAIEFAARRPAKSTGGLAKKRFASSTGWSLTLSLSDNYGRTDSWNVIGVNDTPVNVEEPPQSLANHVGLAITEGARSLAKSLKENSDEMVWNLSMEASSVREGWLKLDGVEQVNALGKKVFVTIDDRTVEVNPNDSLQVILKTKAVAATVMVTSAQALAEESGLKVIQVHSVRGLVDIGFSVPSNLAGSVARVDMVSLSGSHASTERITAEAGSNSVKMQARSRGVYLLRIQVAGQVYSQKILVK